MTPEEKDLIARSLDGDLSSGELAALELLLANRKEAKEERKELLMMRDMLADAGAPSFGPYFSERVVKKIASGDREAVRAPSDSVWSLSRLLRWAAPALALVLVGAFFLTRPIKVQAPAGEISSVTLPDGTTVELAGGSTVSYDRKLSGSERRVVLDGQAFFDVAKDGREFRVETRNASIVVLGTRFNVREDDERTHVALEEGSVRVEGDTGGVLLVPGQETVVGPGGVGPVVESDLASVLAWRSDQLIFRDRPLSEVLSELERRYEVRLTTSVDSLDDHLIFLSIPAPESVEEVLNAITLSHQIFFSATSQGFELHP